MEKRRNIIIVSVVAVVLIVCVVLGIVLNLFAKKSGFKISNEGQYLKDVNQADKDVLMSVLANQVKNVSDIDTEKTLVEGSIREGSYNEDIQSGIVVSNFFR